MRRSRRIPYATLSILALNVIGFLVELSMGEHKAAIRFAIFANVLSLGPSAWYRVFTSSFMHYGLEHLACNMLGLFSFGVQLEAVIGWWRYLIIYLGGIIGNALMVNFFGGNGLHMGASGAIWGLMAAMLVVILKYKGNPYGIIRALVINLAFTFIVPGISWQGHIGGGLGGLLASLPTVLAAPNRARLQARRPDVLKSGDDSYVR